MGVMDFFKPVPAWTADQVRTFLGENQPGAYNLVDVRQPSEYQQGHLPGALLIPVGELSSRLNELDPDKPTITY